MRANTIWLDSFMRKAWYLQPREYPLGYALTVSSDWDTTRFRYSLWSN